jgi:hypothetical protein
VPPSTFPLKDRRTWSRRRRLFRVFLLDPHNETATPIAVQMLDFSPGGMRLSFSTPVDTGSVLQIRPVAAPPRLGWIEVQVKNSRATPQGWELGCQFVEKPSLATLLQFG